MLLIINDNKTSHAQKIFAKWDLDFIVIGKTVKNKNLILNYKGKKVADLPIEALSSQAPVYDRKWKKINLPNKESKKEELKKIKLEESFLKILSSPNFSNKKWVTNQYDQMVMGDTIQRSGSDSAIVRIHKKNKAVAITVDSSSNYSKAHPLTGGKQIVCENWRNLICAGSRPLAITNCLNFGNPENEEIMGEFAETIQGMKEACEYLDFPIVSGNVSFYNGTNKKNIFPTPVIGGIGLIKNVNSSLNHSFKKIGNKIILIGKTFGHLYQSALFTEFCEKFDGPPPEVNLKNEKNNGDTIIKLINKNLLRSAHDVSSGGLIIALAEMSISSSIGVNIIKPKRLKNIFEYFFGEDQGRYLIEIDDDKSAIVEKILKENDVFFEIVGKTQKDFFEIVGETKIKVNELYKINSKWYKEFNASTN